MLRVDRVAGQQAPVFGVEQEHQPHEHGEQAARRRRRGPRRSTSRSSSPLALVVGGLEAAQQFVQGVQHLPGELGGDVVLVLAAVGQERGQALLLGRPG